MLTLQIIFYFSRIYFQDLYMCLFAFFFTSRESLKFFSVEREGLFMDISNVCNS